MLSNTSTTKGNFLGLAPIILKRETIPLGGCGSRACMDSAERRGGVPERKADIIKPNGCMFCLRVVNSEVVWTYSFGKISAGSQVFSLDEKAE